VFVAVRRFFRLKGRGPGNPVIPEPEPHGGAWHAQFGGDPDRRLAPPPSTYGLDDEAKLVASRQAVRLAGAILEADSPFRLESGQPGIGPTGTESNGLSSGPDRPTLLQHTPYQ
jgi:hypothetical protein